MHKRKSAGTSSPRRSRKSASSELPEMLRPLFWEYNFNVLNWKQDRDLVIDRVLSYGHWDSVRWLRRRLGDKELRAWIESRQGRGLSPRQLRFWELILGISSRQVDAWLKAGDRGIWDNRIHPRTQP